MLVELGVHQALPSLLDGELPLREHTRLDDNTIRIMSRWGKQEVLLTEKDGFLVKDRDTLEAAATS